ncbi:hypothetical protein [Streptomyces sp. NPDC004284]|uniref:hypothetical protein n=1 Tax=Streptomyces sp. NPDC004284 TaxID=3364695 RepID=UPI0036BCDE47
MPKRSGSRSPAYGRCAGAPSPVRSAASAVGPLAPRYAGAGGASRVVAAVGGADRAEFVRAPGAGEVVLYGDESWGDPVDVVGGRHLGGDLLGPAVRRALGPVAVWSPPGSGGGAIDAHEPLVRGASVIGFQAAVVARGEPEAYARRLDELGELHRDRRLGPRIAAEMPLADAARARALVESRGGLGKAVPIPWGGGRRRGRAAQRS